MAQESAASEMARVDDFYFSVLFDESPFPISDSKYAEELQLQEALMSITTNTSQTTTSSLSSSSVLLASSSPQPPILIQVPPPNDKQQQQLDLGESSQIFCEICAERKPIDEIFPNDSSDCKHSFCSDCISKHISTKVRYSHLNSVISCPGLDCKDVHVLELEACREILPKDVVDKWDDSLCEALILNSQKFYCPFKDCSAVLLDDSEELGEVIVESECPICHRLFCARCRVPWHSGIGCEEFGRLHEDERGTEDLMLREIAKEKKWKRCPECMFYVERTEGCLHITCRCSFQFCYGCGSQWTQTHGACQRD
ncbi:probable E3 ubiquitin-protein ligase RNF217 [Morus notabilis]|uniref:probable E3 ubiquitin-protein ligase RNF217 n=1 Tax=Morus notabilis TaxID=981085 RepID=UPI000CECEF97|nr:probable E3 ubiquitin-protein ligase RNF217 [Morus notabilis]